MKKPIISLFSIILLILTASIVTSKSDIDYRSDEIEAVDKHKLEKHGILMEPVQYRLNGKSFKGMLMVLTVKNGDDIKPKWYLVHAHSNQHFYIGSSVVSAKKLTQIKVSPNSQYLAVVSENGGHPLLQIVDFKKLIKDRVSKRICTVDPYPGYIQIDKWKGNRLVVESDMLLTHRTNDFQRVDSSLMLTSGEKFTYDLNVDRFVPENKELTDPGVYFARYLFKGDKTLKWQGLEALKKIKSISSLKYLKEAYSKEKNLEIKREIKKVFYLIKKEKPIVEKDDDEDLL